MIVSIFLTGCSSEPDTEYRSLSTSTLDHVVSETQITITITPPLSPVNMEAIALSPNTVEITWLDNSDNEDGFNIYRGNSLIATLDKNIETFRDTGLMPGMTYHYAIRSYNEAGESVAVPSSVKTPEPPITPTNIIVVSVTKNEIQLRWQDNSDNENGFAILRNGSLIGEVDVNINSFIDRHLQPAAFYQYSVVAFNEWGETHSEVINVKTSNPGIIVRIDSIGVYDNGETFLRDADGGEISIGVIVTDGISTSQIKLPPNEGQYYNLYDNETSNVGATVFFTAEVGEYIRIGIIGYELDGGPIEDLLLSGLSIVVGDYLSGTAGTLFEMGGGNLLGFLFGTEDDWLGSYEQAWSSSSNWGIGNHGEIVCYGSSDVPSLRIWFTIISN